MSSGFKLALTYKLRPGQKLTDTAYSNNLAYKKVWPIREAITAADALAFRTWVEDGMKAAGLGGSKACDHSFQPTARTSARVEEREERDLTPIPMPTLAGADSSQPKAQGCKHNHLAGSCRCGQQLIHSGQDESIFKAYQKSNYQYVVNGVRGLRKKGDGPGEMVSGFKDELRGFGHPLTQGACLPPCLPRGY